MVRAAFACGILFCEFLRTRLERGVLFSRVAFKLSAFHGHRVSRVPHARRVREISHLHGPRGVAAHSGWGRHAPLVWAAFLDFHAIHLLEPVALHGAKLRLADDVCAARGRLADGSRAPRAAPFVYRVLYLANAELPHRTVRRCADSFSGPRG